MVKKVANIREIMIWIGKVQTGDFGTPSFSQFQIPDWIPEFETRIFWKQVIDTNVHAKQLTIEKKLKVKYDWVMD